MPIAFDTITDGPHCEDDGAGTLVYWSCSESSAIFQLYADRKRVWSGTARMVTLPRPGTRVVYQVGTVDPGEEEVDFSADLPLMQGGGDKALLSWIGGPWQEPSPGSGLAGFRVYGEAAPGSGIDYGAALGEVPYGVPGLESGGYGTGGYGEGGYGLGGARFWWKSGPLTNGTWAFGVKAYDNAGNEGDAEVITVAISRPPEPPARDPDTGLRLTLSYDAGTGTAQLSWLASPG